MNDEIKPIETRYKGYRFRSRLEARWAVFFDYLGIKWEYELEGYELASGWYLPDFYLPQVDWFAEVKPKSFNVSELTKCVQLLCKTNKPVLLLDGAPSERLYPAIETAEFNHGNWDVLVDFFDIQDGHRYWSCERRFFLEGDRLAYECGGLFDKPEAPSGMAVSLATFNRHKINGDANAVAAARSARFEHGESP